MWAPYWPSHKHANVQRFSLGMGGCGVSTCFVMKPFLLTHKKSIEKFLVLEVSQFFFFFFLKRELEFPSWLSGNKSD